LAATELQQLARADAADCLIPIAHHACSLFRHWLGAESVSAPRQAARYE